MHNQHIDGKEKIGTEIIQSRFFVGVFLKIRDHGHDFLFAQVKTKKKGRRCDHDCEDRLQNVPHNKYLFNI
jgi:hypothetical protein